MKDGSFSSCIRLILWPHPYAGRSNCTLHRQQSSTNKHATQVLNENSHSDGIVTIWAQACEHVDIFLIPMSTCPLILKSSWFPCQQFSKQGNPREQLQEPVLYLLAERKVMKVGRVAQGLWKEHFSIFHVSAMSKFQSSGGPLSMLDRPDSMTYGRCEYFFSFAQVWGINSLALPPAPGRNFPAGPWGGYVPVSAVCESPKNLFGCHMGRETFTGSFLHEGLLLLHLENRNL